MNKQAIMSVVTLLAVTLTLSKASLSSLDAAMAQNHAEWEVSIIINELEAIFPWNDPNGGYDWYRIATISQVDDDGNVIRQRSCSNFENHPEDRVLLVPVPGWKCSLDDVSGPDPRVVIGIEVWDHDWPDPDDRMDIHPGDWEAVNMWFWPASHQLDLVDIDDDGDGQADQADEDGDFQCARDRITLMGNAGADITRISFTVTGTVEGAEADSDGDGLTDASELCGMDSDGDGNVDVDLPGMGADPFRKDLFVELDWMVDSDGVAPADHSHEPWLPALINAWHELDQAPVTAPPGPDGVARRGGIALHVDVGTLYANYTLDFDGDGVNEISADANGNVDVDPDGSGGPLLPDGIVDIGNLGALPGNGTPGGGNRICANLTPAPCAAGQLGELSPLSQANATIARSNNFVANRTPAFRYAIFADLSNAGGNSGWAPWGTLDFIVSLGGAANQGGGLVGPAGLPVRGRIGQHTGTFLHELGHSLGLGHGGGDSINRKPNYISIMSYDHQFRGVTYDLDGDGLTDPLNGYDFNQDGLPDNQRYTYSEDSPASDDNVPFTGSRGGLPPLNEIFLDEPEGVGDGQAIVFYGPSVDLNGDGVCDVCPLSAVGNQPIDWSRGDDDGDGTSDNDINVDTLTANLAAVPPIPPGTPTDINRDGLGAAGQMLTGFNDYNFLQNKILKYLPVADEGVSQEEDDAFVRSLVRVKNLTAAQMAAACNPQSVAAIKFDELMPGNVVSDQYAAQGVTFVADGVRRPTVTGPPQRYGIPTQSMPHSLVNSPVAPADSGGIPLVMVFDPPVRLVSLRLGRVTQGNPLKDVAVLTAFDADGFPMGSIQRAIPDFNQGVTAFLGMGAIFPKLLISRIELNYVLNPTTNPLEPEHIDDVIICRELVAHQANFPDAPQWGERTVRVEVAAAAKIPVPTGNEEHPFEYETAALPDIAIHWERTDTGQAGDDETAFSLNPNEGENLRLIAPAAIDDPVWGPLTFIYWLQGENHDFGREDVVLAAQVLRNTSFTAVYRAGSYRTYLPLILGNGQSGGLVCNPTPTPTLTPTSTPSPVAVILTPVADAYIYSAAPTTSYGSAATLYVGSQSTSATGRALFRFDLDKIPTGATVLNAEFQADLAQTSSSPATLDVELKRVDTSWQEDKVAWSTSLSYTGANNVTGVETALGYYSWDVTSLVQTWVNGASNHGLALMSKNESTLGWRGFASRESVSPPSPPRLTVTYRP